MKYFLLLLMLYSQVSYASSDVQSNKIEGTQIQVGSVVETLGNRYASSALHATGSSRSYWTASAYGLVTLACPTAYVGANLTGVAQLNLLISYEVEANGTFVSLTKNQTLKLDFTNGYAQDFSFLRIEGAQKIRAEILPTGNIFPVGWPSLELKVEIQTESFEWMLMNAISSTTLTHSPALTIDGNLKINWTSIASAEYYELEWTYLSDQSSDPAIRLTSDKVKTGNYFFRNNSSRVEVKDLSYDIPMIYEKGFIIYRLRAVGKTLVNGVMVVAKSEWTLPDGSYGYVSDLTSTNVYTFNGLEENLNWQSSLSFAEEGKHKVVLSYHDGSSRNRQAVTRINSDKRSVVGETLYDYNGRPTIQTLPVPVTENSLTYYPRFNLVEGSSDMTKQDYDQAQSGVICNPLAPSFSKTTGASNYYSENNSFNATGGNTGTSLLNKDLIPNADKFPYTQTYYTADNTGRIAAQSGVGALYRIGTKKETRYYYGTPYQPELARLFGPQVGYAGHYKKNMVVDPNGQTSVSYLDLDGKVVATALSGNSPTGLDALEGNNQRTIQTEVLNADEFSNVQSVDRLSKKYSSKFTVASPSAPYKFTYKGVVGGYDITCALPGAQNQFSFIMDGAVNVEWQLVNTCGEPVFVDVAQTNSGNSGSNQTVNLTETKTLPEGEYQLTKKISIDEEKLEEYWQAYLNKEGICIIAQQSFVDEELGKMNLLGCGLTCEECATERDRLLATGSYTESERENILSACDELCDPSIGCRGSLEMLRGDMSPGGQYGKLRKENVSVPDINPPTFDENGDPIMPTINSGVTISTPNPDDNKIVVEQFPMSIYNPYNGLRLHRILRSLPITQKVSWRNPILIVKNGYTKDNRANQILYSNEDLTTGVHYDTTSYTDRSGNIFYVDVYKQITDYETGDYVYSPEVIDDNKLVEVDESTGLYKIQVEYLKNLEDFERYWQPHWSNYLIPYHPEFEYLLDCTGDQEELAFDYLLMNTTSVLQAKANDPPLLSEAGDPLIIGATRASSLDPYIRNNQINYLYIKHKYNNFLESTVNNVAVLKSMAEAATIAVGCPQGIETCGLPGCLDGKIDRDDEWNVFKALYLSEKQKIVRQRKLRKAVNNNYYNGCIGQPNVYSIPDAGYFRQPQYYLFPDASSYRACGWIWTSPNAKEYRCSNPIPFTLFGAIYPINNPNQLCFVYEIGKYKHAQQRFYQNTPSSAGGGITANRCSTFVDSDIPGDPPILIPIPCETDIREATNSNFIEAQRYKYEQCGLCPMAQDVEDLIKQLKKENILTSSVDKLLTCPSDDINVIIGPTLSSALLQLNGNLQDVFWNAIVSVDNKSVSGRFLTNNITLATLELTIPTDIPVTFSNLRTPCCFTANTSNGSLFTMESSYINELGQEIKFTLNGSFSLPLSPCYIPPRCAVTSDSRRVLFFLNSLVAGGTDFSFKRNNLNSNGLELNLLDAGVTDPALKLNVSEYYTPSVRTLLKKDDYDVYNGYTEDIVPFQPKWTSSMAGNILTGTLTYLENNNTHTITIEIADMPAPIESIKEFDNVRPVPLTPDVNSPCNGSCEKQHFLADVLLVDGNGRRFETVNIYVPTFKPVICKEATPPASN